MSDKEPPAESPAAEEEAGERTSAEHVKAPMPLSETLPAEEGERPKAETLMLSRATFEQQLEEDEGAADGEASPVMSPEKLRQFKMDAKRCIEERLAERRRLRRLMRGDAS